jgi:chaperonin cofactor prefoldin
MNHKPKVPGSVFYVKQRSRIQARIRQLTEEIKTLRPYPVWLHQTLDTVLSPFSNRVRAMKNKLRKLQAEFRRLEFKLRMMLPINNVESEVMSWAS